MSVQHQWNIDENCYKQINL